MGLPALKQEPRPATRRSHLRVVDPKARVRAPKTGQRQAPVRDKKHAAAYQAFVFFATIVVVVAVLGVGRVWMSVEAAQASIDCGKLQTAIKSARYEGDMLEIQQSVLQSPSRVQAIASGQLGMAPATSVSYMNIAPAKGEPVAVVDTPIAEAGGSGVLDTLVGVAAAEARMLLVGDVGLASSR
jgi:cell division protein FtsL